MIEIHRFQIFLNQNHDCRYHLVVDETLAIFKLLKFSNPNPNNWLSSRGKYALGTPGGTPRLPQGAAANPASASSTAARSAKGDRRAHKPSHSAEYSPELGRNMTAPERRL